MYRAALRPLASGAVPSTLSLATNLPAARKAVAHSPDPRHVPMAYFRAVETASRSPARS